MPSPIRSDDPDLQRRVVAWLAESRLPPPDGLEIDIAIVPYVESISDTREVFAVGNVDVRAGEPGGWVHLTWQHAPAWARIEAHRPSATVRLTPEALVDFDFLLRSFLLTTLIFICKRDGRYHVHAATAIDPTGRGWMLIGDSCSGKSTTTALLATRHWRISTDDIAFLQGTNGRAAVTGFRSPVALRPGGRALLQATGGIELPERGKVGYDVEMLGAEWVQTVEPETLVFTSVGGSRTTLTPMTAREALNELMVWSRWVMFEPTAAQEHLDLLAQLIHQARCYRAELAPDLFTAPGALMDFLP